MSKKYSTTEDGFQLNAVTDMPDIRDLKYQPALVHLDDEILPPENLIVLNQGTEGACTGFGLAATINYLKQSKDGYEKVSPRMLYEMARKFDEWDGEKYSGSSCRGAIRGWQNMGVCSDELWPYVVDENEPELTVKRAKDAHSTIPGAYYRLSHRVEDFHTALNEVGVLYVSAKVHKGWYKQNIVDGKIPHMNENIGGHAFAVVGYNEEGFYVQNSWGKEWGVNGVALWSYKDWQENIADAWVVQLAISTPQLWSVRSLRGSEGMDTGRRSEFSLFKSPKRHEIKGHFVHIDDGHFHTKGKYFSSQADVQETADLLKSSSKYKHLLLYAHGGLNSPKASAKRIAAMKDAFKDNGIYPYHFMYDTGLLEELKDIVLRRQSDDSGRSEGLWNDIIESWDRTIENTTRVPGRAFWREMKQGARSPFNKKLDGTQTLITLIGSLPKKIKIHVVGHSTGAILLAHLLQRLSKVKPSLRISTCSLMAPACTKNDFKKFYAPLLSAKKNAFGINAMTIYNMTDKLELDDNVAGVYRKSLLYLVSKSYEEKSGTPILGMQNFSKKIVANRLELLYSEGKDGKEKRTRSESHGGFDNDEATMNDILERILGGEEAPTVRFTEKNLKY